MPLTATPKPTHKGWFLDQVNGRLYMVYNGVKVGYITATAFVTAFAQSVTGGITAATGDIVATLGNIIATAADIRITAGNLRLGVISTFGTTEPTSAVVMKVGTAPVGAITTSSGIYASSTVCRKFIADGTNSNVET